MRSPTQARILETDRLHLTPFEAEDLSLLHELFTHPFLRASLWDNMIIDLEESEKFILANQKYFHHYKWGLWKIWAKPFGKFVGFAGLWPMLEEPQPQLLYGLFPEFTGRGMATEAVAAVVDLAFNKLGFSYLNASVGVQHEASQKVVRRLGMHLIESMDSEEDMLIYGMNVPLPHRAFNLN